MNRYVTLFFRYLVITFGDYKQYKSDFFGIMFAGLLNIGITHVFWQIIFSRIPSLNGWDLASVILLQGYLLVFLGFYYTFFRGLNDLSENIIAGTIDKYLSRPVHPLIVYLFEYIEPVSTQLFVRSTVYFLIAFSLGLSVDTLFFAFGLFIAALSAFLFGLMVAVVAMTTFWLGPHDAVEAFFDILWSLADYPVTIYPVFLQTILVLIFPLFFTQTLPSMVALGVLSIEAIFGMLLIFALLIFIWTMVVKVVWKLGLRRYSSYGG